MLGAWKDGSVLVQTRDALSAKRLRDLFGTQTSWKAVAPTGKPTLFSIKIHPSESVPMAVARFRKHRDVLYAEPNYIYRLAETIPNDTYFASEQWALRNVGQKGGVFGEDIDATSAWDIQTGSPDVVVAVIDTGLAVEHPDIRNGTGNVWINSGEIPGNAIDDDGNGYVDDWRGWNFFENNNNPSDKHSHGTHVSGTIGAIGNNRQGVSGVCWQVRIMALAAFNASTGEATNEDLIEAIAYAVNNGARIINASWGEFMHSRILEDSIRAARDAGVLFVAAAGNNSLLDVDRASFYPAGFELDNIISVASSNVSARISNFSNQGAYSVDLFAPGESIFNLSLNGGYAYKSGTSMATPHVSGAAALVLSEFPDQSFAQVKARILGAVDVGGDYDDRVATGGRLNVSRLFEHDTKPPTAVGDLRAIEIASDGATLAFTVTGDDGDQGQATGFEVRYSTNPITEQSWSNATVGRCVPRVGQPGDAHEFTLRDLRFSTTYHIAVKVYDNVGNFSEISNVVSFATLGVETLWLDDAESEGGFLVPSADGLWTRSDVDSFDGSFCWTESATGEYGNNVLTALTSLPFSLQEHKSAWLEWYHWYDFEYQTIAFYDGGELQISTDSDGIEWRTLAWFDDTVAPWHRFSIPLTECAGEPTVRVRFRFRSNNVGVADGWFIDDVRVYVPEAVCKPDDIIMESNMKFDNVAVPLCAYQEQSGGGAWFDDTSNKARRYRLQAKKTRAKSIDTTLGSQATFIPLIPRCGMYEVYTIWGSAANAKDVRYRVKHTKGISEVIRTQDPWLTSDRWISLGTYPLSQGRLKDFGSVTIDDSTVTGRAVDTALGRVYADGIRLRYVEPMASDTAVFWHVLGDDSTENW